MRLNRTPLLLRDQHDRDARLFVVATEGSKTEKQYFEGFNHSRVKVEVLETGADGCSSPNWVLDRLAGFDAEYAFEPDDERWLVLDVDRWSSTMLKEVCRIALQKRYRLGISNPCFELFLYLHLSDADFEDPTFLELVRSCSGNCSEAMEGWLRRRLLAEGGYQKTNLQFERFRLGIPDAIRRARALDRSPKARWPSQFGTHVYRLVEQLHALLP